MLELARTRTHSCWSAWKTCLLWSVFGPPSVRFFLSLALPRSARFGLGVWCWCFLFFFPFFFCVPRLVSRLGKVSSHVHGHFIFMSISPTLLRQGVCVCHLNRCKTSHYCRGVWHSCPTTHNEAADMSGKGNVAVLCLLFFFMYSPAPGGI